MPAPYPQKESTDALYPISDADLGKRVKAKYPDAQGYANLPDDELGRMVKQKYPQYAKPVLTEAQFKEGLKGQGDPNWQNPEAPLEDVSGDVYAMGGLASSALKGVAPGIVAPLFGGRAAAKAAPEIAKTAAKGAGKVVDIATHPATAYTVGLHNPPAGFALRLTGKVRDILKPLFEKDAPKAPEPFRPNPNIARTTRYGGPAPKGFSPPGKIIPRKGFTPPEPEVPTAPEPFKANPATANRMRYGGPKAETSQVGKIIPRKGFTPPESTPEPTPQAPEPFKPNPRTAQKVKFGGPKKEGYTAAPPKRSGPTPKPQATSTASASEETATVTTKAADKVTAPKGQAATPSSKPPFVNNAVARHTVARNISIAKELQAAGVKAANVAKLDHGHWAEFAKANGFETPNRNSVQQIIAEMKRLESMPSPKGRLTAP